MLSSIGDELYAMAFVWFAVTLIGANTGYLSAVQSLALVLVSLFGGKWADQWDHFKTLVRTDLIRGVIVLIPVLYAMFFHLSLSVLFASSIFISALCGFFDPALSAIVPSYCSDNKTLQAANGLMSTTIRMARVLAPIIIGCLTGLIPMIHFFTIDAFTFFFSAITVMMLMKHPILKPSKSVRPEKSGILKSLKIAIQTAGRNATISRALTIKSIAGGMWKMAYVLGIALLIKEHVVGNIKAYGIVMGAYGLGNILTALYLGNRERKHPEALMYVGFMILGLGFIWIGFSTTLISLSLAAAFTAIGGPMNDLPFADLVMAEYETHDIARLFRLRTATETGCGLIAYLSAPFLFQLFSVPSVVMSVGVLTLALGTYGRINTVPASIKA